jgi:uncharacterized protein (DUF433 family)
MKLPDYLTEVPFGKIRLTGHRIGLYHVLQRYKAGSSVVQLHEEFPALSLDLLYRVVAFYEQNRDEVEAYLIRCEEEMKANRQKGKMVDVEELVRRWQAMGRTLSPA